MDTRERQIRAVAGIIAGWPEDWDAVENAEIANRLTGWTFETSAPLGNVIRHEGVVLTEAELAQAVERARTYRSE